jgi:hypothetical protein
MYLICLSIFTFTDANSADIPNLLTFSPIAFHQLSAAHHFVFEINPALCTRIFVHGQLTRNCLTHVSGTYEKY